MATEVVVVLVVERRVTLRDMTLIGFKRNG